MEILNEFITSDNNCLPLYNLSKDDRIMYRELLKQLDIKLWCRSFTQKQATKIAPQEIMDCIDIDRIMDKVFVISKIRFNVLEFHLKQFMKWCDYKLPTHEQPWLDYYVKQLGAQRMYDSFVEMYITHSGNVIQDIMTSIINNIKSTDAYTRLVGTNIQTIKRKGSTDNYHAHEDSKYIISIDMMCANFNAAKQFDKELMLGAETWQELIQKFLPNDGLDYCFLLEGKKIRQILFGMLNGKKSTQLYTNETTKQFNKMHDELGDNSYKLKSSGDDEFWYPSTETTWKEDLEFFRSKVNNDLFRVRAYYITPIGTSKGRLFKELESDTTKIKCLNGTQYMQAIKYLNGEPLVEADFKVMIDGYLATYDKPFDFNNM